MARILSFDDAPIAAPRMSAAEFAAFPRNLETLARYSPVRFALLVHQTALWTTPAKAGLRPIAPLPSRKRRVSGDQ